MGEPNLKEIHDLLLDVAKKAGQMIVSANPSTVDTKKNCTLPLAWILGLRQAQSIVSSTLELDG